MIKTSLPLFKSFAATVITMAIACLLVLPNPSLAQKNSNDGTVTLSFIDSNLEDVVKGISAMSGVKFLIPNDLKNKKINLVSDSPIPSGRIYNFLLTALRSHRLTIVESDGIMLIVPENKAWSNAKKITSYSPGNKIVSKVFRFKNTSAATMANIIRPFLSQKGYPLVPNTRKNSLVIVDYAQNLRNLEVLINSIDSSDNVLPVIFPLTHISANEAETSINNMLANASIGGLKSTKASVISQQNIIADIPNNRLLIRAEPERLEYISKLLAFIDVPRKNAGLIHIYKLKYANAETIAQTLSSILSDTQSASPQSTTPTNQPKNGQSKTNNDSKGSGGLIEVKSGNGINIKADPATNSIIVVSSEVVFRNVVEILQKLDVRRRQVFVEVLIAEIQGERTNEFSVQWLNSNGIANANNNKITAFGGTNLDKGSSIVNVAQNPTAVGQGLNLGVIKGTVSIPGIGEILNLGMLARALETRLNANILSSPNLMVLNNEESKLSVGANVPVLTGQYNNTASGTSSPFQTIERKDVGVSLTLKPQIMDSGVILLDIQQEVSDILSVSDQGPTTSKRSIDSRVLLNDGQTVVLGGLISEKINDSISKVPILGDIPLLGALFRSTKKEHKKSNLLLFIRPSILNTGQEVTDLSTKKYNELYGQMPYTGKDLRGIFADDPKVLPPLPNEPKIFPTNLSVPKDYKEPTTSTTNPAVITRKETTLPNINNSNEPSQPIVVDPTLPTTIPISIPEKADISRFIIINNQNNNNGYIKPRPITKNKITSRIDRVRSNFHKQNLNDPSIIPRIRP